MRESDESSDPRTFGWITMPDGSARSAARWPSGEVNYCARRGRFIDRPCAPERAATFVAYEEG